MIRFVNVVVLSFLLVMHSTEAQAKKEFNRPDYEQIENITKNSALPTYYPILFSRYEKGDTSLTLEDYYLLYYGYFFQESYNPLPFSHYIDSIKALDQKGHLTDADEKDLIRFHKELLKIQPFNLRSLNMLGYIYHKHGNDVEGMFYTRRALNLINIILATGDGKKCSTGIYVASVGDEYSIISFLGYDRPLGQSTSGECDYLELGKNKDRLKGMYFNVEQICNSFKKHSFTKPSSKN